MPPAHAAPFTEQQKKALADVTLYMYSLITASGTFEQVNPNGQKSTGTFYLDRPGKLRFAYAPPQQAIIIANGRWISVQEKAGAQANRFPVSATPLSFFLDKDIDFRNSPYVHDVSFWDKGVKIELRDPEDNLPGSLTLYFSSPQMQLLGWNVVDIQNQSTFIGLTTLVREQELPNNLFFVLEDEEID